MALALNGRIIEYTNQVIYEEDFLRSNLYKMTEAGALGETILGFGPGNTDMVRGFACTPISPPGMSVVVGPGVMYSYQPLDATAYGVLPADTNANHKLYKQGFHWDPVTLPVTAPVTPGQSVIYLVQAQFQTVDVNNVSRPYYNSANPVSPIFNSNYDTRQDIASISIKSGTPGVTPVAPSPDAGHIGLWHVTIANGQTTVVSGDIAKVSTVEGSPFITEGLTQKVGPSEISTLSVVKVGTILATGADTPDTGYLMCDHAAVSRTTYSALFARIGTRWGAGDGSTTFNVPGLNRRTLVGSGGTGTGVLGNAVGDTGGAENHSITTSEMPAHTHVANAKFETLGYQGGPTSLSVTNATGLSNSTTTVTNDDAGSGAAMSLMQPSAVVLFQIKY